MTEQTKPMSEMIMTSLDEVHSHLREMVAYILPVKDDEVIDSYTDTFQAIVDEALRLAREPQPAAPEAKATEPCRTCKGTGMIKGAPDHYGLRRCLDCGGSGNVIAPEPATPPAGEAEALLERLRFLDQHAYLGDGEYSEFGAFYEEADYGKLVALINDVAHAHAAKAVVAERQRLARLVDVRVATLTQAIENAPMNERYISLLAERRKEARDVRQWLTGDVGEKK